MSVGSIDALTSQRQTADAQGPSATQVAAARKVAQQFEAIFLRKLMSGLEKSGSLGGSSTGSQVYGSMMVGALADSAAKGGGLGLADLVMKSLLPQLSAPAHGAAAAASSSVPVSSAAASSSAAVSSAAVSSAAVPASPAGPGSGVLSSALTHAPPLAASSTPAAPLAATPPYRIGAAMLGSAMGSGIGPAGGSGAAVLQNQNASGFDDPMGDIVP
jgi:flagellar protein FlgJ